MNDLVLFFTEDVSVADWHAGGMLARELALYRRFVQMGKSVEFVTYGSAGEANHLRDVFPIAVRYNRHNLPANLYKVGLWAFPPKGSIFKSNQVSGSQIALAAARRARAKFVARCGYLLSFVDEKTFGFDSPQAKQARGLERTVFRQADCVIVTTQRIADHIRQQYSLPEAQVRVIPNYVETDRFCPATRPSNSRAKIGFVGRLAWEKNLTMLIQAAQGLDVDLVFAGDGPQRAELIEVAQRVGVNLTLLGRIENANLPEFLNSCDMFVLPSVYEGHPKALIEAMACGLPVIGTRVPGIAELIADEQTGLLCELDPASLQKLIGRLLGDSALRQQLGAAARAYVVEHLSLERIAQMELALYEELTGA